MKTKTEKIILAIVISFCLLLCLCAIDAQFNEGKVIKKSIEFEKSINLNLNPN